MLNKIFTFGLFIFFLSCCTWAFAVEQVDINLALYPNLKNVVDKSDQKDKIMDSLKDAGTNWENLAGAADSLSGQKMDDMLWLITVMPHLDRLEATKEILLENLEYAYKAKEELPYKIPDEMFRSYILAYRIGDEPVRPWRKMIFDRFRQSAGNTASETARNVNKWVNENVKVFDRGFFGPRQSPDQVIKVGAGTKEDVATVTTAILKTLGVPSRKARCEFFGGQKDGSTWVEIYDGANWIPLYPDAPDSFGDFKRWEIESPHNITVVSTTSAFDALQVTPKYTETGTIELSFIRHGVIQEDFQHFAVSVYNNGGWMPLDDLGFDLEESRLSTGDKTKFEAVVGDGKYLVEAGVRNRNGDVHMYTEEVTVTPGVKIPIAIKLDPPIGDLTHDDLFVRDLDKLPEWELPLFNAEGSVFSNLVYESNFCVLALFDTGNEPSIRMIPKLADLKLDNKIIKVVAIHAGPAEDEKLSAFVKDNSLDFTIAIDKDGTTIEKFGLSRRSDDKSHFNGLPSIMLFYKGRMILWVEGHDPGIRDFLLDMVKYQESLGW
jgi:hypothetical protein